MSPEDGHPPCWQVTIPNRLESLMRALDELESFLGQCRAGDHARHIARLAVEEFGTNIIKYGYDDEDEHEISIRAVCEKEEILLEFEDDGREFDPTGRPDPDADLPLQERTPGGWGISLVRRLLRRMQYENRDGRNLLRLVLSRNP